MLVPPAFNKLCSYFHQDIGDDKALPEEWIDFAKRHLDSAFWFPARARLRPHHRRLFKLGLWDEHF